MTDLARLLLTIFLTVLGFAIGRHARGWHDGSTVSTAAADAGAQAAVVAGTEAAVQIDRAKAATDRAVERVRYVQVPVSAPAECPPGEGAMSPEMDAQVAAATLRHALLYGPGSLSQMPISASFAHRSRSAFAAAFQIIRHTCSFDSWCRCIEYHSSKVKSSTLRH